MTLHAVGTDCLKCNTICGKSPDFITSRCMIKNYENGWLLRKQLIENCQLKLMAKDGILCLDGKSPPLNERKHAQTTHVQMSP